VKSVGASSGANLMIDSETAKRSLPLNDKSIARASKIRSSLSASKRGYLDNALGMLLNDRSSHSMTRLPFFPYRKYYNSFADIKELLDRGASVNRTTDCNPLYGEIQYGVRMEVLRLQRGADVNIQHPRMGLYYPLQLSALPNGSKS
jgi:hypothetical protein